MRSGLVSLLGLESNFSIAGQGSTPDDSASSVRDAQVMLWDVAARAAVVSHAPALERTPTLALAQDDESALELLRGGAVGVLLRSADGERLVAALRAVAAGLGVFDPALLRTLLGARAAPQDALLLTPREAEVLSLMAEGLSNKLIADRLKISDHTAKFHVNSILNKLSADTRTEAVVIAARRGLLML